MTEKVYVLNEKGEVLGLQDRQEVHKNGTFHVGVQCWLMNSKGQILIQRRSAKKEYSPGKWDVSFGGHCTQTDNKDIYIGNLIKEGNEELGLSIDASKIIKLGEARYTSQGGKNRELLVVYLTTVPDNQKFVFKDGEVSDVKWTTIEEFKKNIIEKPAEYANRMIAVALLEFYEG